MERQCASAECVFFASPCQVGGALVALAARLMYGRSLEPQSTAAVSMRERGRWAGTADDELTRVADATTIVGSERRNLSRAAR
jgi:hypothetical protein